MSRYYQVFIRRVQDLGGSDELVRRLLQACSGNDRFWEPAADVYETRHAVKIKVELAGVRPNEIQVELGDGGRAITVRGVRRDVDGDREARIAFHQMEVYVGPFHRDIPLPSGLTIDASRIEATYHDGFLLITLPKVTDSAVETHQIPIQG